MRSDSIRIPTLYLTRPRDRRDSPRGTSGKNQTNSERNKSKKPPSRLVRPRFLPRGESRATLDVCNEQVHFLPPLTESFLSTRKATSPGLTPNSAAFEGFDQTFSSLARELHFLSGDLRQNGQAILDLELLDLAVVELLAIPNEGTPGRMKTGSTRLPSRLLCCVSSGGLNHDSRLRPSARPMEQFRVSASFRDSSETLQRTLK